jgi:hypothetical protein
VVIETYIFKKKKTIDQKYEMFLKKKLSEYYEEKNRAKWNQDSKA